MPWTFAHPAAILPLRRLCPRWLSLPALILGAMAPDMSYYIGMHARWRAFCHTPEGVVLACLPVCLLMLALLLRFARPVTVLLPEPHRTLVLDQLQAPPRPAWAGGVVLVLSVLLGAATHLLWDTFTHDGTWGTAWLPELDEPLWIALDRPFHLTHLLQHLSTAAGVVVLAFTYRSALRDRPQPTQRMHDPQRTRVLLACVGVAIIVGAASAHALTPTTLPAYSSHLLVRTVVWSTSCFITLFVIASAVWWRWRGDA